MIGCKKCQGICGWSMVVAGVLFLLRDLDIWDFWNIQWWTVLFLLMGIGALGMKYCPDCQAMMKGMAKK